MTSPPHRYREIRPLAQGGMATLALAERDDGEVVVVKRVRPPLDHDPVYRGLFHDEGELCACLSCEHIVQLLDRGEDEAGPYLVFEYVDGTDLGVVLEACFAKERGLELQAFFAVALPLCEALASAHEATATDGAPLGLVHRDVSPGNVLLSKDGDVKLADFGVALSRLKTEHTVAGEMKGKFAYMAPEQTRGEAADARSDVFAAGIVLWECLSGRRLFDGPTDADVVHAVRASDAPRLSTRIADVPPAVDELVARMLARDPTERPSTLRDVHASLAAEANALGLERGLRSHVARVARAHPRPDLEEHPHVAELRRRTQRVLQPPSAPMATGTGGRRRLLLALTGVVVTAASVAALAWSSATATTAPSESAPPSSSDVAAAFPSEALPSSEAPSEATEAASPTPPAGPTPATSADAGKASPQADENGPTTTTPPPPGPQDKRAAGERATRAAPVVAKGFGTLVLDSEPWAHVAVDGEPLGRHTPLVGLRLPAGRHKVTLENPVYGLSRTIDVDIRAQAETRRYVDLTKRRP